MVGITYVYIDTIFRFMGNAVDFFLTHHYCLVGCLSMIVWTHAVLGVLHVCVLYFCICTCSVQLSMFHMERRSRNTIIITIIIIINFNVSCLYLISSSSHCLKAINLLLLLGLTSHSPSGSVSVLLMGSCATSICAVTVS